MDRRYRACAIPIETSLMRLTPIAAVAGAVLYGVLECFALIRAALKYREQ